MGPLFGQSNEDVRVICIVTENVSNLSKPWRNDADLKRFFMAIAQFPLSPLFLLVVVGGERPADECSQS
jgi:hypothetical protein